MQNGLSFKNTMSRVGLCYFVLMLVTQALQLAGMTLLGSLLETGWGLWALSYAPLYCIAVPVFILLLQKLVPGTPGTAGSAALTAGGWLRWLVLCLGVTYLFNFVSLGITALLGMLKGGAVQNPLALMQMNSSLLATFLFACVLAPVGEEFLFRKLLYDKSADTASAPMYWWARSCSRFSTPICLSFCMPLCWAPSSATFTPTRESCGIPSCCMLPSTPSARWRRPFSYNTEGFGARLPWGYWCL